MADERSRLDEKEKAIQSYAALSIGVICVLIGVPVWWKTTQVYRVGLPYAEISSLADIEVRHVVHFDVVTLTGDNTLSDLAPLLSFTTGDDIPNTRLRFTYIGHLRQGTTLEQRLSINAFSVEELEAEIELVHERQRNGNYTIYVVEKIPDVAGLNMAVGQRRMAFVTVLQDIHKLSDHISHIIRNVFVNEEAVNRVYQSAVNVSSIQADKESMRALRSSPGYDVTFTLLNPQPDVLRASWDVGSAVDNYMHSMLTALQEYTNVTVKSQYLYSTGLGVQVEKTDVGSKLSVDQLPHIINPIEAFLGSHVSTNPNINFIVYVPTREQSPLMIYDADGKVSLTNAFLSPRWGGLLVYNVDRSKFENQSLPVSVDIDMYRVMSVFTVQLRLLLGIHPVASSKQVAVVSPGSQIIADWELDQWLIEHCIENIFTSSSTLISLAELLGKISNIVINDEIGAEVVQSVHAIQHSTALLANGQLREAFLVSKVARDASEKAFFDQSLLELLYFPEDQKFAIYVPLFLPVGFPIVLSLIQAVKWLRGTTNKEKKD